jgi:predicted nucleic acid-binding protein
LWLPIIPDSVSFHPGYAGSLHGNVGQQKDVARPTRLLLIDERRGRLTAQRLGIPVIGLLGVLLLSKRRGLIPSIRPVMDDLRIQAGFWISEALFTHVLRESGEA